MANLFPSIGSWHQSLEDGSLFEVVALDEHNQTIEVQYSAGEIDEFDFDTWPQLPLAPAAPPEDADIAFEISKEDRWEAESRLDDPTLNDPLNYIEGDSFQGLDDDY